MAKKKPKATKKTLEAQHQPKSPGAGMFPTPSTIVAIRGGIEFDLIVPVAVHRGTPPPASGLFDKH